MEITACISGKLRNAESVLHALALYFTKFVAHAHLTTRACSESCASCRVHHVVCSDASASVCASLSDVALWRRATRAAEQRSFSGAGGGREAALCQILCTVVSSSLAG